MLDSMTNNQALLPSTLTQKKIENKFNLKNVWCKWFDIDLDFVGSLHHSPHARTMNFNSPHIRVFLPKRSLRESNNGGSWRMKIKKSWLCIFHGLSLYSLCLYTITPEVQFRQDQPRLLEEAHDSSAFFLRQQYRFLQYLSFRGIFRSSLSSTHGSM